MMENTNQVKSSTPQFESRIRVFQGTDTLELQTLVNAFNVSHNVFATQHSTCLGAGAEVVLTIIVFYRERV